MKLITRKQLYFIFLLFALLIASITTFFIKQAILPYTFRLDKKTPSNFTGTTIVYEDINNDGISEEIRFGYFEKKTRFYFTLKSNNKSIKKFIFNNLINYRWLLFADYNDDNYKDIFAFSLMKDSLCISIIDTKTKKFIIREQSILAKPDSARKGLWDIEAKPIVLLERSNKAKELIFFVRGNSSIYPRDVYSYNFKTKKITSKFATRSRLFETELLDITNDGNKEIIITTSVFGNVKKKIGYHDFTGWLFVLNKSLKPIFPPKSFGTFPGNNHVVTFKKDNKNYFYILYYSKTDSGKIGKTLLLDSFGKELPHLEHSNFCFRRPLKITDSGNDFIYLANNNKVLRLNSNLELIKSKILNVQNIDFISEIEIGQKKKKVILIRGYDKVGIVDKNLTLLALYNLPENFWRIGLKYIKLNGKNKLPQLPLLTPQSNYLFTIVENKLYTYIPLYFFGLVLFIFITFIGIHKSLTFLSSYIKYFGYSLNKSTKGVALFNANGFLYYYNSNFSNFLNIKKEIHKGINYKKIFKNMKTVLSAIEHSFKTQKKAQRELQISSSNHQFEGMVTITPFTSFIGFTYAYLIEISDFTEPLLTDRGRVWGATLQRIAHEIKTPLSGINLGLDTLANKLKGENNSFGEDISLIHNEVEKIKILTKNFLIFSNMEKPNFTEINLSFLINESLGVFHNYLNSGIELILGNTNYSILGDFTQLKQLFHIVLENAIDACGGKGKIKIKAKRLKKKGIRQKTEGKNIELESTKEDDIKTMNNYIKISITDSGKGIPEEDLTKIFEPYYTTKKDGTGVGLAIVKKIIEDHRGRIKIDSELGEGTTVFIYIPST